MEAATAGELVDIFKLLERPGRTIPKNQDEDVVEEEEEKEEEEVREWFIAWWAGPLDYSHDVLIVHVMWSWDPRTKTEEDPSKFHIMTEQVTGYLWKVWIRMSPARDRVVFTRV